VRLFHLSEDGNIARFEPRAIGDGPAKVWAIEQRTICNYLLPRDCPRVCFRRTEGLESDLLGGAQAVVAIETGWLERVRDTALYCYEMPVAGFALEDRVAGYWTSVESVQPLEVTLLVDLPVRIAQAGAELRVVDTLWPLHDSVVASGLDFSMIRMRNAGPR